MRIRFFHDIRLDVSFIEAGVNCARFLQIHNLWITVTFGHDSYGISFEWDNPKLAHF